MNSELEDLLNKVKQVKKSVKKLNYRVNVLYAIQWEEKVVNGYQKWRFDPEGGLKLVREQLEKLDYKCPVCQDSLTEKSATIDHLHPKSKYLGAAVDLNNMLIMCHSCNSAKNNQEFEVWYLKLPIVWRDRLDKAITEIHGMAKLTKLLPNSQRVKKTTKQKKQLK